MVEQLKNLKNPKSFRHWRKILIVNVIITVFCLVLVLSLVKVTNSKATEVSTKRNELGLLKKDLESLDKLLKDRQDYEYKTTMILRSIPNSYEEVAFYTQQLEKEAGEKNQVLETTIDESAIKDTNGLSTLKFTIKTKGKYNDFAELISRIENLPYHVRMDSIKVDESEGSISTLVSYRIYLLEK
jgi:Tfp pilus assembly protein PilO